MSFSKDGWVSNTESRDIGVEGSSTTMYLYSIQFLVSNVFGFSIQVVFSLIFEFLTNLDEYVVKIVCVDFTNVKSSIKNELPHLGASIVRQ